MTSLRTRNSTTGIVVLGHGALAQAVKQLLTKSPTNGYRWLGSVTENELLAYSDSHHPALAMLAAHPGAQQIVICTATPDDYLRNTDLVEGQVARLMAQTSPDTRVNLSCVDAVSFYARVAGRLPHTTCAAATALVEHVAAQRNDTIARGLSLVLAAIGLVLAAPMMLLIALAIKLDSPGPLFFTQRRGGRSGRAFRVLKFRTMTREDKPGTASTLYARDNCSRVTTVGAVLRTLHLDELPQLLNILRGDMNLVGPRPEIADNIPQMANDMPLFTLRHAVRPGLTGLAQIRRGYAMSKEAVSDKLAFDLCYVVRRSVWLDLAILFGTVRYLLRKVGAIASPATAEPLPRRTQPLALIRTRTGA